MFGVPKGQTRESAVIMLRKQQIVSSQSQVLLCWVVGQIKGPILSEREWKKETSAKIPRGSPSNEKGLNSDTVRNECAKQ